MRQIIITVLMLTALMAFGATAASAGCCQPKCKQHTCTKACAPKCEKPCKMDCCKPKCEPVCKPKCHPCKPKCEPVCKPKCEPVAKPMPEPCYCCPLDYSIKPFGYEVECPGMPMDHPGMQPMNDHDVMPMGFHGEHHHGHHDKR